MDSVAEEGIGVRSAKILYPLFMGQGFGVAFTALTFIVVARILNPTGYGVYTLAFGFAALVNGFLAFGVGAYFSTMLAGLSYKKDGEGILRTLSSGYIIAGTAGIVLTLFGIGVSSYLAGVYANLHVTSLILMAAAGTIIFNILETLAVSALIGFSRTDLSATINVVVDLIQLALSVMLTIKYGVIGAVSAMLIGYLAGAVIGAYLVYRVVSSTFKFRIYLPSRAEIGSVFRVVWPLAATNFLNTGMQNFSILFLGFYVTLSQLGNYGAASKGYALLFMIYSVFGSGLLPIFTTAKALEMSDRINSTYNKIIHFALIPMLPIIVFVGVMAAPGLDLFVGSSYSSAPLFLTLIAAGSTLGLFGTYISELLISGGHTSSVMKVNFISAVLQLVFMLLLVPYLKVIGAILTIFFIGNAVEAVFFSKYASRMFGLKLELRKTIFLYVSNAVLGLMLFLIYISSNILLSSYLVGEKYILEIIVGVVISLLVYPGLLIMFRAINDKDILSMRYATNKLGRVSNIFGSFFDYSDYLYQALIRKA